MPDIVNMDRINRPKVVFLTKRDPPDSPIITMTNCLKFLLALVTLRILLQFPIQVAAAPIHRQGKLFIYQKISKRYF